MKTSISKFISAKTENIMINENQQRNILEVIDLSGKFNKDAGILEKSEDSVNNNTIVLEAAHQPNYFPYSGVFKKAFLLNYINEILKKDDKNSITFFGFADQNQTTSPYLYKNIIPGFNKTGVEKIGFNIKGKDKWKCFNRIAKPPYKLWEEEIKKINTIYSGTNNDICQDISEIMWKSYENADNFPDLNAFIFSKICTEILNLNLHFFRYSDIHQNKIFINETKNLLKSRIIYNNTFNSVINREKLNIREIKPGEIPLWYHCRCGGKVLAEFINPETCSGICPVCKKFHNLSIKSNFENIDDYFKDMSFSAVARNLIFAEGLGTSIYISGAGGGLRYGKISDEIAPLIGFKLPATLAWISRDYYIGHMQKLIIKRLQKGFNIDEKNLLSTELNSVILEKQNKLLKDIRHLESCISDNTGNNKNNKSLQAKKDKYHNLKMTGLITSKVFSSTPSSLDLFMNIDSSEISDKWKEIIKDSCVEQSCKAYLLKHNITYEQNMESDMDSEKLPALYHNLINIPVI
ncbi:MAG: hypothetical protein KAW93_09865 [Methanogenium sp.]|nr:hypothetical protein [Methanogenium sp.]